MARKKAAAKRAPTPARAGDTLDNLPSFSLPRELYEAERKEVYTGILLRLSELKSIRKKTADVLGITADQEREVSRVIHLYEGDDGILALFQNADEEAEFTAEEVKKGGKDRRQRELPIDEVPSGSTEETRGSTEPVGVLAIDQLVDVTKPHAPSDMDWDAFRRVVVEMTGDERRALHEYAERWHQYNNLGDTGYGAPKIPGFLHALFTDLSPAYAKALGGREDVLYETDMARAMAKAKHKRDAEGDGKLDGKTYPTPTSKQLAALQNIEAGHEESVSPSMYRKLATLGLVRHDPARGMALTESGKLALAPEGNGSPAAPAGETGAADGSGAGNTSASGAAGASPDASAGEAGEMIEASPAGLVDESVPTPEEREKTHALIASDWDGDDMPLPDAKGPDPDADTDPSLTDEAWQNEVLRTDPEEPVAPLSAIANQESK
jgi:hypothetical protein